MGKTVRKIESISAIQQPNKRVAAYARVSSGKDAMLHSLSAQVSYYSDYIQRKPGWRFVGIYADEALTGTKDTRPEFQRLLADCRAGKIDLILTKSISRFARNTLTLLETTRELKALGVNVYFEEQGISTISGEGEMILTLLASVAQEESRAVSENCKWRIRSRFQNGELVSLRGMYGYSITKGMVGINPEQAAIVRMIFADYIAGLGCGLISKKLREMAVPGYRSGVWSPKRVLSILKNEKYAGNALLQKRYVIDHLSKKEVHNNGVLPQYYAEETHPAIISVDTFEAAQAILASSRAKVKAGETAYGRYPFSGMITCGQCGKHYRRKVTAGKAFWSCSTYNQLGKAVCPSKQIPEETLYTLTCEVLCQQTFDEDGFKKQIFGMCIPSANMVIYTFADGREVEAVWKARSRSESWTDEMRQQARDRGRRNPTWQEQSQ